MGFSARPAPTGLFSRYSISRDRTVLYSIGRAIQPVYQMLPTGPSILFTSPAEAPFSEPTHLSMVLRRGLITKCIV